MDKKEKTIEKIKSLINTKVEITTMDEKEFVHTLLIPALIESKELADSLITIRYVDDFNVPTPVMLLYIMILELFYRTVDIPDSQLNQ